MSAAVRASRQSREGAAGLHFLIGTAAVVALLVSCSSPCEETHKVGSTGFQPVSSAAFQPVTLERLTGAARAAGFRVLGANVDIPEAVRSHLPFVSIPDEDPRLAALREKYHLEAAVAGARDEWSAQLFLKDWVHRAIPDGTPKVSARHAAEILEAAARGETFWCTYYAITYVECALALGWPCRNIAVDRRHGPEGLQSTHHGVAEIWSNQFRKWVVIDPQSNLHFEREGIPLSAWEIRAEYLRNRGKDVLRVVGTAPKAILRNPAIRWWNRPSEDETACYFWLYVIDHADMSAPGARFLFPQDDANRELIWYQNDDALGGGRLHEGYLRNLFVPTPRIEDIYWTVGVVEATILGSAPGEILLAIRSEGPGRAGHEVSFDGKTWAPLHGDHLRWGLKEGWNSLRVRSAGPRRVTGPELSVLLLLDPD